MNEFETLERGSDKVMAADTFLRYMGSCFSLCIKASDWRFLSRESVVHRLRRPLSSVPGLGGGKKSREGVESRPSPEKYKEACLLNPHTRFSHFRVTNSDSLHLVGG